MQRRIVKITKMPNDDLLLDLVELMLYYNLSYNTGQRNECTITIDDAHNRILTPDTIYKLSDDVYIQIYLLSNKALANIYKTIRNDLKI